MAPLLCTQNTLFHVDYGVPIVANKSTDYRTSTGKNHEFTPSIAQHFDCRVKAKIKPELLDKDIALRNEYKTTYNKEYQEKYNEENVLQSNSRAISCKNLHYIRNEQEKIFKNPPPLKPPKLSEMKDSYQFQCWAPLRDKIPCFTCQMPDTYRGIQPNIYPADKGFYKLLDIYLTENKLKYVPYTNEQLAQAQEDFITFYNANGTHKGLKEELPGKLHGRTNMYDTRVFKVEFPNRFLSRAPKRVPNLGMTSEYQSNYPNPAFSDIYPYTQGNGQYFPDSLSGSGPWQDLCPPAMYCSENCHIGTGWPVRAAVDIGAHGNPFLRNNKCCTKI